MISPREGDTFELVVIDWEDMVWLPPWVESSTIVSSRCINEGIIHQELEKRFGASEWEAVKFMQEGRDIISAGIL